MSQGCGGPPGLHKEKIQEGLFRGRLQDQAALLGEHVLLQPLTEAAAVSPPACKMGMLLDAAGLPPSALEASLPGGMPWRLKGPCVLECQSTKEVVASIFLFLFSPNTPGELDASGPQLREDAWSHR